MEEAVTEQIIREANSGPQMQGPITEETEKENDGNGIVNVETFVNQHKTKGESQTVTVQAEEKILQSVGGSEHVPVSESEKLEPLV